MAGELPTEIKEVWDQNLVEEVNLMSTAIQSYPYVAMDTEFPGKVHEALNLSEYRKMKANVDHLKIIQIGLTLFDGNGNLPTYNGIRRVWQFNFREFNENTDEHAKTSIDLLKAAGIDFVRNLNEGIAAFRFGELLTSSGLVLNKDVRWVTFHGGYDCGYLVRLLINANLPEREADFYTLVKTYFPVIYDIKYISRFCNDLGGGLVGISSSLGVYRNIGIPHQAGSDSFLTFKLYKALKESYFQGLSPRDFEGDLELS